MPTDLLLAIVLILVLAVILLNSVKIAREDERFAVFVLGRFAGFKGPGLILRPSPVATAHRLKVGDVGVLTSREFARFGDADVPVKNTDSLEVGRPVRIDAFLDDGPRLVASAVRPSAVCPKCGHQF